VSYQRPQLVSVLAALVLLSPAAAWAQVSVLTPTAPTAAQRDGRVDLSLTLAQAAASLLTQQPPTPPPPPPPPDRGRRRPSMVGYITDAGIQSQVRVRFDAGTGIDAADRAEFFYAKCGCYRFLPSDHPLFDPEAKGPGPGITTDLNFQQVYAQVEYGFSDRVSLYGELPIRWIQPQGFVADTGSFEDQSGLSDLRAGVKWALVAQDTRFVTLQLQGNFPTGDGLKGLGVEHFSVEPALLYNQSLNDIVTLEGQFGVVVAAGGSDGIGTTSEKFSGNVLYYGIGPSFELYRSDNLRFAPVVELIGWRVLDGYQTATFSEADGVNIVNLKIGGRFEFRNRSSVYVGYGRGVTDDVWYEDLFRLEYRYSF
jgi:hypothetical protein